MWEEQNAAKVCELTNKENLELEIAEIVHRYVELSNEEFKKIQNEGIARAANTLSIKYSKIVKILTLGFSINGTAVDVLKIDLRQEEDESSDYN